jgi:hypothetical protein
MPDIPPYGSRDYRLWEAGARAENEARRAEFTEAGQRVVEVVESLAAWKGLSEGEIAAYAFRIFAGDLPFWRRVRLAWQAVRRG